VKAVARFAAGDRVVAVEEAVDLVELTCVCIRSAVLRSSSFESRIGSLGEECVTDDAMRPHDDLVSG
jgi:hypothetical protein